MAYIYISPFTFTPTPLRTSSFCPSSSKISNHSISIPITVSCKATNDHDPQNHAARRSVLFGLGGLFYANTTLIDSIIEDKRRSRGFGQGKVAQAAETKNMVLTPISAFPLDLDKVISTEVSRPRKSRSKKDKEDEEEVLVIEGIDFEGNDFVKFDVYVNDEGDQSLTGAGKAEFAGSFVNVPHRSRRPSKACLTLAINELLDDLEAEDDESLMVTLVPRSGKNPVSIGCVKIEYITE